MEDRTPRDALVAAAWGAVVAGDSGGPSPDVSLVGPAPMLPSHLPVDDIAAACIAAALSAASALSASRENGAKVAAVELDRRHVAAAVTSERHFRHGDVSAPAGFAPLSRFWATADGWIRTHANYPWHRGALLRCLGLDDDDDAGAVARAIAERDALELEDAVFAAGGIAAAVRSGAAWLAHPQGAAVLAEPLIGCDRLGNGAARRPQLEPMPVAGVRVLDLTRVIAGPVCTRFLGALGADVLRVDPPGHLDIGPAGTVADTLLAKRSAFVDLSTTEGAAILHELLDAADVVVSGYRPGALDRFGLDATAIAERHPGVVVICLDAWGHTGPWATRRGFDSVVQAPTGVALVESSDGATPGTLPCQLLDHGTGYLAAAAALDALRRQSRDGGTYVRRLSLARTASWLLENAAQPLAAVAADAADVDRWRVDVDSPSGPVSAVAPPGRIGGTGLTWTAASAYGRDEPAWLDR